MWKTESREIDHRIPIMARYGDETTTGRVFMGRVGPKITVAARAEDPGGFAWWRKWRHDYVEGIVEPKSDLVLKIAEVDPRAKDDLYRGLSQCPVFIIDFEEYTRELLAGLREVAPEYFDPNLKPLAAMTADPKLARVARGFSRSSGMPPFLHR